MNRHFQSLRYNPITKNFTAQKAWRQNMKKLLYLGLLLFLIPCSAGAEEIIKKDDVLNIDRCIAIAAQKQPSIIAAQYTVNVNWSRVGEAQSNYYPQLSASAGYSRIKNLSFSSSLGAVVPSGYTNAVNDYFGSLTLSQLIYDFGKTSSQVSISKLNLDSSRSDLETTFEQVTFNVKQAYYGLLQSQRNREVAADTVKQNEQHLEQAEGFFKAGTHPKYDVTTAQVNLSNAKLNLITAETALRVAKVILDNAIGVPNAPDYSIDDNLAFEKYAITMDEALEKAYRDRPDLQSLIAKRKAAEKNIELQKTGYYPVLTAGAAYNVEAEATPLENGWNVGAAISLPIFNGFLTKKQVEEAKGNLNVLSANEQLLKQNILLNVQQAYLNLNNYEQSIATAELTVKQATENRDIADGRYAAGVGNPIEVTDAEIVLTNAKTSYIQALYNYKIAKASLEMAMGMR
jgi:outer membrane protein